MRRQLIVVVAMALCSACASVGQNNFTRILGPYDRAIVPPPASLQARKDSSALEEILAFIHKTGMNSLVDLQATGSGALPAPDDHENVGAMMMAHGADRYRLDLRTSHGTRGVRIYDTVANMEDEKGTIRSLPQQTGASSTLAFARLADANLSDARVSVLDQGFVSSDGASLHRVSVQLPIMSPGGVLSNVQTVTDYYFDSTTHLLVKTADNIVLPDSAPATLLRVVTYGDYRTMNGVMVPFLYKQTLNGQPQWTLQFDQITVNAGIDDLAFQFTK